jgi:hypothetical protein
VTQVTSSQAGRRRHVPTQHAAHLLRADAGRELRCDGRPVVLVLRLQPAGRGSRVSGTGEEGAEKFTAVLRRSGRVAGAARATHSTRRASMTGVKKPRTRGRGLPRLAPPRPLASESDDNSSSGSSCALMSAQRAGVSSSAGGSARSARSWVRRARGRRRPEQQRSSLLQNCRRITRGHSRRGGAAHLRFLSAGASHCSSPTRAIGFLRGARGAAMSTSAVGHNRAPVRRPPGGRRHAPKEPAVTANAQEQLG